MHLVTNLAPGGSSSITISGDRLLMISLSSVRLSFVSITGADGDTLALALALLLLVLLLLPIVAAGATRALL